MGFSSRWRDWISALLSSASTKILLNGRPGNRICHTRGLCQGDPLSPMLFVLAMEGLNSLIAYADQHGFLSPLPLPVTGCRVSLYADDLVIFVLPEPDDLLVLRELLGIFANASGLFVNWAKMVATGIHCSANHTATILQLLGCVVADFPCIYLGIPLSVGCLRRTDEQPIIDAVARRIPTWKGHLLNLAGRATLTAVTLSAIPTHVAIATALSQWAIDEIDKRRRGFLWSGTDKAAGGKCKVAWESTCRPRELGGLGLLDLRRFAIALRLRWAWLWRVDSGRPWTRLPQPHDRLVQAAFAAATTSVVGDGRSTLFWTGRWLRCGLSIQEFAP